VCAAWHSKRRAYTRNGERTPETASVHRVTRRADPARARHAPSGGVGSRCKRAAFASQSRCWEYWSVYGVTPRAPGVFEAVRRIEEHSNGMPRICWQNIFYLWETQWYSKPLKQCSLSSEEELPLGPAGEG